MNLWSLLCAAALLILPQPVRTSYSTYSTSPHNNNNNNFVYGNQLQGSDNSRRRPSPSIINPVEMVSFQLMDDQDDQSSSSFMEKSRYDWAGRRDKTRRPLPLLSRGERETDFDDFLVTSN